MLFSIPDSWILRELLIRGVFPCSMIIWKRTETSKPNDLLLNGIKLENKIEFEHLMGLGVEWDSHRESAHPHCGNYTAMWMEIPSNDLEKMTWEPSCASRGGWKGAVSLAQAWPVGSLKHTHTHTNVPSRLSLPHTCAPLYTQKIILYGLQSVHAHIHTHLFPPYPFRQPHKHTHHTPSNIPYTVNLLTKHVNPSTCPPKAFHIQAHTLPPFVHMVSILPGPQPLGWKHGLAVGLEPWNTGTEQPAGAGWLPDSWHEQLKWKMM